MLRPLHCTPGCLLQVVLIRKGQVGSMSKMQLAARAKERLQGRLWGDGLCPAPMGSGPLEEHKTSSGRHASTSWHLLYPPDTPIVPSSPHLLLFCIIDCHCVCAFCCRCSVLSALCKLVLRSRSIDYSKNSVLSPVTADILSSHLPSFPGQTWHPPP